MENDEKVKQNICQYDSVCTDEAFYKVSLVRKLPTHILLLYT